MPHKSSLPTLGEFLGGADNQGKATSVTCEVAPYSGRRSERKKVAA